MSPLTILVLDCTHRCMGSDIAGAFHRAGARTFLYNRKRRLAPDWQGEVDEFPERFSLLVLHQQDCNNWKQLKNTDRLHADVVIRYSSTGAPAVQGDQIWIQRAFDEGEPLHYTEAVRILLWIENTMSPRPKVLDPKTKRDPWIAMNLLCQSYLAILAGPRLLALAAEDFGKETDYSRALYGMMRELMNMHEVRDLLDPRLLAATELAPTAALSPFLPPDYSQNPELMRQLTDAVGDLADLATPENSLNPERVAQLYFDSQARLTGQRSPG